MLDLACGTGDLCRDLKSAGHHPIGMDLSWGMLAAARADAPLVQPMHCGPGGQWVHRWCDLWFALRNFASLEPFLDEMVRVLRPGGRIALLEVDRPLNPLLRVGHNLYFGRVVPLVGVCCPTGTPTVPSRSVAYLPPEEEF
ncbi:MAG: hypothetical protein CM1200mP26_15480 [Acidimicrobiales bacterium]|nr:MAG: hypothetical protein CM1200mP26_15480 [Acidimicrobiales bacterium]